MHEKQQSALKVNDTARRGARRHLGTYTRLQYLVAIVENRFRVAKMVTFVAFYYVFLIFSHNVTIF